MEGMTIERLRSMRLPSMAERLLTLCDETRNLDLPWKDVVAMLVDAEHDARSSKRLQSLLRNARLKHSSASIENISYEPERGLKKDLIRELSSCRFIDNAHNVLISGPTGTGKSWLACALASHACRNGYRTGYWRVSIFLDWLANEKNLGTYPKAVEKLRKLKLLVLDDLGADILGKVHRGILFDIVEERSLVGSIVITSQVPVDKWGEVIGEAGAAEAICDRLLEKCHKIPLKGASMRRR
jgi:DNA replication protein DnaC